MQLFLNGDYHKVDEAFLGALDRGVLFGDGVFTTIKVEGYIPLFLDDHVQRLRSSCHFFGIEFSDPGFGDIIDRLVKQNLLENARVKILISRGVDSENRTFNYHGGTPTIMVQASPLAVESPKPLNLCISKEVRGNEAIYHHKTISYLQNLHHKTTARERGFDDAAIQNLQGKLLETSMANLFFISGSRIITPPADLPLLNGIMRKQILSQGSIGKYQVVEDSVTKDDLNGVDAIFATSAIVEICPVATVENLQFSVKEVETVRKEWLHMRRSI
jgi:branched-subunit amino acid aminotransferase/4-amino-4-deoxychorismate lyase